MGRLCAAAAVMLLLLCAAVLTEEAAVESETGPITVHKVNTYHVEIMYSAKNKCRKTTEFR